MQLPRNWMHLHFLRAIGTAMSMRAGIAADAAAALLFRILSQPALLFPPIRQVDGVEVQHEPLGGYISSYRKQVVCIFIHSFSLSMSVLFCKEVKIDSFCILKVQNICC